jgi:triacylglycerol lipase
MRRPPPSIRPLQLAVAALLGSALWACAPTLPAVAPQLRTAPDFAVITSYALLAQLAYQSDSATHARLPGREVAAFDLPAVAGRVVLISDPGAREHTISVRGTANLHDALLDAEVIERYRPDLGVRLHLGFDETARAALAAVRPLLRTGYRVNLTGHSLGGAAAAIIMMELLALGVEVGQVITFGQPMVTDAAGAALFGGSPLLRVADCRDPVPRLPPPLPGSARAAYRHFGTEVLLLDGPDFVLDPGRDERPSAVRGWTRLLHDRVSDHHMAAYLARLEGKRERAVELPASAARRPVCAPVSFSTPLTPPPPSPRSR